MNNGDKCTGEIKALQYGQREVSFWNQLTSSISYGFDFSSGNTATTSSLSADVVYRTAKKSVQLATGSTGECKGHQSLHVRFAVRTLDY